MPGPTHYIKGRYVTREVLAAWFVASVAVVVGLLLLALHEPNTDDRLVPRALGSPTASAVQPDDVVFVRNRIGWAPPQSGSSTAPDTARAHR